MSRLIPLHKHPQYENECAEVLNEEWKRSLTSRLHSMKKSRDSFPMNLVLLDDNKRDGAAVIGHSRLSLIQGQAKKSCLVESVCVRKSLRGKGYGRIVMEKTEEFAASQGIETMYLTTHDKQKFYKHLGYEYCSQIVTIGMDILPGSMAEKLIGSLGLNDIASSQIPQPGKNTATQKKKIASSCDNEKEQTSSSVPDKDNITSNGPSQTDPSSTHNKVGVAKSAILPPVPPPCPVSPPTPAKATPTGQPDISRFDPRHVSWMKKEISKT